MAEDQVRQVKSVLKYGLPLFFFFAASGVGVSLVVVYLTPLDVLGVPYPRVLAYWHVAVPVGCAVLWLATVRWWPVLGGIVSVLLCYVVLAEGLKDMASRVAHIPVTRWLTKDEQRGLDAIPIRIFEQSSTGRGSEVLVAPENEERVRAVVERLGLLREKGDPQDQ